MTTLMGWARHAGAVAGSGEAIQLEYDENRLYAYGIGVAALPVNLRECLLDTALPLFMGAASRVVDFNREVVVWWSTLRLRSGACSRGASAGRCD
jgi:hypothetical protein